MRWSSAVGIAGLASLAVAADLTPSGARADDLPWDNAKQYGAVGVRDRPRAAFEPDGIRVGNYILMPEIGFRTSLTKDTFDAPSRPSRDLRYEALTGIELRSQLPRHQLDLKAEGRAVAYQEQDDLRYIDGKVKIVGRLDITHATSLFATLTTELVHDENVDAEQPKGARSPPTILKLRGDSGLQYRNGRIDAAVGARYTRFDYHDAVANDGSLIEMGASDFWTLEPFIALGARLSPGYRVFGEVLGRRQENRGDDLIDRDADGFQLGGGVEMELSPVVKLMLKGGYFQQDYRQPGLIDIATPVYEARLEWYVTPLVTLTFDTRREVRATTFGEASGRVSTSYNAKAEYEMWRNLILTGEASYKLSDYVGENRIDKVWSGRIGMEYLASKHWLFTAAYEHQALQSNESDLDRRIDKFTIGAKYRF